MAKQPEQQQPRFIKLNHVRSITALSTSEIYRRIAAGTFPAQIVGADGKLTHPAD